MSPSVPASPSEPSAEPRPSSAPERSAEHTDARRAKVARWRRRDAAASRASAYVYGNILILAALAVVDPQRAGEAHGVSVLLGAGVATFAAHVFSELVGHRVRRGERAHWPDVKHEMSLSTPIVTSTVYPALALGLGILGWVPPMAAFALAVGVTTVRLALLGSVLAHLSGRRRTLGTVLTGVAFAVVCLLIAALKVLLAH